MTYQVSSFFPLREQFALNHEQPTIDHLRNRSRTGLLLSVFVNSEGQRRVHFAQQVHWVKLRPVLRDQRGGSAKQENQSCFAWRNPCSPGMLFLNVGKSLAHGDDGVSCWSIPKGACRRA